MDRARAYSSCKMRKTGQEVPPDARILFSGADDSLAVSPWAIVAAVIGSLVFFVSVMTAALRVRLRRPVTTCPRHRGAAHSRPADKRRYRHDLSLVRRSASPGWRRIV